MVLDWSSFRIILLATGLVNILVLVHSQASQGVGCVFKEDSCPCSQMEPSGVCMKPGSDGLCLLGKCQPGYRCDCLGYAMCKRSKCAMYTAVENAIPSESIPFRCHLTPDAGRCTTFDHVLDTVESAENAAVDSIHASEAATTYTAQSLEMAVMIQADVAAVSDTLKAIEPFRDGLSNEEIADIEQDTQIVVESAAEAAREASEVSKDAAKVFKNRLLAAEFKKEARQADMEAKHAEQKLKENKENAERDHTDCRDCNELKAASEKHTKNRKEWCSKAGEAAKLGRSGSMDCAAGRDRVNQNLVKALEAKDRLDGTAKKLGKHA
ncbi:hypothetical protein BWQ96_08818 [Gracilariopsis chorda]|uniref:Uncharacterized protein n=1 Tax=Gracilariopsis chorda TaxID=448386 RepID=A0A2V3IH85_9FLOR|nr:hypothetical protein BWQ96_08818 [Gracilariopsis chorda]|eukprot:PXF41437.1 hypothetical protein BWQ96_08818 [Gracilariopsis chorda]